MSELSSMVDDVRRGSLSRREFLDRAAVLGLSTSAAAALLTQHTGLAAAAAQRAPQRGGTLIMAAEAVEQTLEPTIWQDWASWMAMTNIADRLVYHDFSKPTSLQPMLATDWSVSADGLTWTFKLRKGVTFHDGTPFSAVAVAMSLNRQLNAKDPFAYPGNYTASSTLPHAKAIRVVDAYTVQIILSSPDAAQPARLIHPAASILSPTALRKYGAKAIGLHPVGSGPFVFESIQPGSQIAIKANPNYWGGAPYLDRVVIQGVPDEATLSAGLMAGSVGLTDFAPISQLAQFEANPALVTSLAPPAVTVFMALNALFKPLNNKVVRQAINFAINRDTVVKVVFPGVGVTPAGIVTPDQWAYFPNLSTMGHYDPERARSLLKQAGLAGGFKAVLQVQNTSYWPLLGQVIQSELAPIGINVTLQKLDAGTFWNGVFAGKSMMSVTTRTSLVPDPDDFLTPILRSDQTLAKFQTANSTYPDAKILDSELNDALAITSLAQRKQRYLQIEQRLLDDVPYVYLAYVRLPVVMSSKLHNVDVAALGSYQLYLQKTWMSQ